MNTKYMIGLVSTLLMCNAHASCNYKDAQKKMMESNNVLQTYSMKQMDIIANGNQPPAELTNKIENISKAIADNGIALSEIGDPLKITYETKVPQSICNEYDRIITTYTPKDYKNAEIVHSADTPFHCKDVSDADLWMRYAEIIKIQPALIQQGKITNSQATEISMMMSEFGTKMTTDFPAACAILIQVEEKIKGYQ
jgi:hypothetical protein